MEGLKQAMTELARAPVPGGLPDSEARRRFMRGGAGGIA